MAQPARAAAAAPVGGQPAAAPPAEEHPLSLRVMRLCRPTFHVKTTALYDADDLPLSSDVDLVVQDPTDVCGFSSMLTLPQSFGNIYLGEAFSCCIRVFNQTKQPVQNVVVKAELQSNSQRVVLLDTSTSAKTAVPREGQDYVVTHELRELQVHILICVVTYNDRLGERKFFRKYFRFSVLNPLMINTKVTEFQDHLYLEAHLQNQMTKPLCFEAVKFDPTPAATLVPSAATEKQTVWLGPADVQQFLFKLQVSPQVARSGQKIPIGKLEVIWHTTMGEQGRLQTLPIHSKSSAPKELIAELVDVPAVVEAETVFDVKCRLTNATDRPMLLNLSMPTAKAAALIPCGLSGQTIGVVKPGQAVLVPMKFFAAAPGIQRVIGLQVTDSYAHRTFDLDNNLVEVFVRGEGDDDATRLQDDDDED